MYEVSKKLRVIKHQLKFRIKQGDLKDELLAKYVCLLDTIKKQSQLLKNDKKMFSENVKIKSDFCQ